MSHIREREGYERFYVNYSITGVVLFIFKASVTEFRANELQNVPAGNCFQLINLSFTYRSTIKYTEYNIPRAADYFFFAQIFATGNSPTSPRPFYMPMGMDKQ